MRRVMETTEISVIKDEIDPNAESDITTNEEHLIIPKGVEVYEINGPYFFGIATKFEEVMAQLGDRPKVRIIRMRKVPFIDSTGIHNLESLCKMSQKEKSPLYCPASTTRCTVSWKNPASTNCWGKRISVPTSMWRWKRQSSCCNIAID